MGRFPRFRGTMRPSDALAPFSPHFVSFAWRYHSCVRSFVSPVAVGRSDHGPGVVHRGSPPGNREWGRLDFPGSWRTPMQTCPAHRTPVEPSCQAKHDMLVLPSARSKASAPTLRTFGAQSHGLSARCLRFAAGVTPRRRKTRFRLLASFAGRGWGPLGSNARFQVILSSSPRLRLAQ